MLKFVFSRQPNEKTLKEITEEIKISEEHLEYLIIKRKFVTSEFLKKVTGRYKDLKIFKAQKWLLSLAKQLTEDMNIFKGLSSLSEEDIKQGKKYRSLRNKLDEKKFNFLESFSCALMIADNLKINHLLIRNFLSEKNVLTILSLQD